MEAHTPRLPSSASRDAVIGDPDVVARGLATDAAHIRLHFYNFGKTPYTVPELQAIGAVYDAALRDLDDATRRLFEGLDERGLLDETVVVLTSDHGENLGDHGLFNHRFALWRTLTHVPLVVWHPDLSGERRSEPVSTRDLFGTVARLSRVRPPAGLGDWFEDPSPAATWLAEPLRREIETVQNVHPDVELGPWMKSGHALVVGRHKIVATSDGEVDVYDLEADPGELWPLDDAGLERRLERELGAYLDGVAAPEPDRRTPSDVPVHQRAEDDELTENLGALGYFE